MRKYLAIFAVILLLAAYVARQDDHAATGSAQPTANLSSNAVAAKPNEQHPEENVSDAERDTPSWYGFFRWPNGTTTWAIILTLLAIAEQTKETARAAKATEESVKSGKDTAKRQLRAYMVVRNARLILHEDGFVEAKMELANCGQTPAYDLRGGTFCRFAMYPIRDIKPMPDNLRQSQSTIGAGLAFWALAPGGRHDEGDREDLLRKLSAEGGNLVYCVNGHFTYNDIFRDSHWIKFQMIVGGPGGVRLDADKTQQWASFSNDSEGNEEDHT